MILKIQVSSKIAFHLSQINIEPIKSKYLSDISYLQNYNATFYIKSISILNTKFILFLGVEMFYTNILVFVSAISAQNLCSKFTPNIKKILDCVNVNKNVIKIVNLKNESSGIAADDFVNEMIPNLDIPVQYSDYDDQFEYLRIDFTELYSWTGEMFQLRKTQENQEIITDGVSIAHPYQSLRGADSASIILVVENIDILEDYLTGTVRSPFHSTRATFNLVILTLEDNILERVTRILGSIWRNYGIILAVLIFTCEDNVSYLFFSFVYYILNIFRSL